MRTALGKVLTSNLGERGTALCVWSAAVPALVVFAGLAPRLARAQQPAGVQQPVTAFVNVAVIPMDRERVLQGQTVVVRGDRIVALGPAKKVAVPAAAVRVDGRGKFLIPGLADMHMHVAPMGPRHAERILFLLLANGVTTIRNVDYLDDKTDALIVLAFLNSIELLTGLELLQLRARLAAGELVGPRMYTSGQWHTDTGKSVAANVTAYKAAGYDFIKVHDENGPRLDSLVEAARRVGIPIMGHPVGGLEFALRHRFASLEHLAGFPRWGTTDSIIEAETAKIPAVAAATRQAGTWVVPTLVLSGPGKISDPHKYRGNRYLPPETQQSELYAGRDTLPLDPIPSEQHLMPLVGRLLRALQAAGVGLLVGTDSPLIPSGYSVHHELEALVRVGGLTPYEALLAGTRNVAAYFGTLDSAGTVAVGKRADLVLLTANPLGEIRHTEQIAGVMAGGRWWSQAALQRRLDAFVAADAVDAASPLGTGLVGRWRSPAFTERTRMNAKGMVTDTVTAQTTFRVYADRSWLLSTTLRARPAAAQPDTVINHGGAWRRSGDTLWLGEDSLSPWAKTTFTYMPDGDAVRGDTVTARPMPRLTAWTPYRVTLHNQRLTLRRLEATDSAAAAEPFVCDTGAAQSLVEYDRLLCPGVYDHQSASTP